MKIKKMYSPQSLLCFLLSICLLLCACGCTKNESDLATTQKTETSPADNSCMNRNDLIGVWEEIDDENPDYFIFYDDNTCYWASENNFTYYELNNHEVTFSDDDGDSYTIAIDIFENTLTAIGHDGDFPPEVHQYVKIKDEAIHYSSKDFIGTWENVDNLSDTIMFVDDESCSLSSDEELIYYYIMGNQLSFSNVMPGVPYSSYSDFEYKGWSADFDLTEDILTLKVYDYSSSSSSTLIYKKV